MARPQTIEDDALIARLSGVFRDAGYKGASLGLLAEGCGLQKASLYHRFPGGKQQMAEEVIAAALDWYEVNIFAPLRGEGTPRERLAAVGQALTAFYADGRKACLLNMLAAPPEADGPFAAAIRGAFTAIIDAFCDLAREAGHDEAQARARATRVVMLLHGSLVLSRGLGSSEPFHAFLASLPGALIEG
ncbi:MAG: TetR/AcrR family transcriptional regulator [Alphaproteobacteria bacterium HGW-Alphaproteobacteria-6]|nr:MAG: TetR/AcrR family transcriptional regulator [Alphaproteobacteria bacterium HGW-Alphaproteobacteria-6]